MFPLPPITFPRRASLRPAFPAPSLAPTAQSAWVRVAVVALLCGYAIMAYTASLSKGLSFDEGEQLAVGYNIWVNGDYRAEGANGDFVKRWATLPYLVSRPNFVGRDDPNWRRAQPYGLGYQFFFGVGNQPAELLRQARAMIVLLGVATGLLVFSCSRAMFGEGGGLVSLVLFAFSPNMLAFGGVVSTDMSITLFLAASTRWIWLLLHEVTWSRVLVSLTICGLLVLAKASALAIVPIAAVLVAVKFVSDRPLVVKFGTRLHPLVSRRAQAALVAGLVFLHFAAGWTAIWANYGGRFAASPNPADPSLVAAGLPGRDAMPHATGAAIDWALRTHFLPEGFLLGVRGLLSNVGHLSSFMDGEWRPGGRPDFFLYAMWVKTSPALLLLLALGAAGWWWARRSRRSDPLPPESGPGYELIPHLTLIAVYLAIAITQDINIGHRHVLPIYPSLYSLAGAAALVWSWRGGRVVIGALFIWLAGDSLAIRPHYLAYFGPQAGGPAKGYTHLVDSSLDWGMNLPGLRRWLDVHNPTGREQVSLAYFGTDDPDYYGIKAVRLPGFPNWRRPVVYGPLRPGYFAISASILQGVYSAAFGPWSRESERAYRSALNHFVALEQTKPNSAERRALLGTKSPQEWQDEYSAFENLRFARLCAWLRHRGEPPYHVGYAIFVWALDDAALKAALYGPPAELVDAPLMLRRL